MDSKKVRPASGDICIGYKNWYKPIAVECSNIVFPCKSVSVYKLEQVGKAILLRSGQSKPICILLNLKRLPAFFAPNNFNMKNSILLISFLGIALFFSVGQINAQVSISNSGVDPDSSAMLDVVSTEKGILIPRMTTAQRNAIANPANGLLVFDSEENLFYYFISETGWVELNALKVFAYNQTYQLVYPDTNSVNVASSDFVFGSPQLGDTGNSDHDQRFFFDKSKGAFRAGDVKSNQWDDENVGNFSVAFGKDTKASGKAAFAIGRDALAEGDFSFAAGDGVLAAGNFSLAMGDNAHAANFASIAIGNNTFSSGLGATALGYGVEAPSALEMSIGSFPTSYIPNSSFLFHPDDRLFTIGNGTDGSNRSNALTIFKNGNGILKGNLTLTNGLSSFTFPNADGAMGQVLTTDGNGNLAWNNLSANQLLSLNSNTLSLTNGGSVDLSPYLDNTDDQNLSLNGNMLEIENGNPVDLSGFLDNTDNQSLSLSNNTLSLTNGGSVDLSPYLNNIDEQALPDSAGLQNAAGVPDSVLYSFAMTSIPSHIEVVGNYAFVARVVTSPSFATYIDVYDLSAPSNISMVAEEFILSLLPSGMALVEDNVVFQFSSSNGFRFTNISNPTDPGSPALDFPHIPLPQEVFSNGHDILLTLGDQQADIYNLITSEYKVLTAGRGLAAKGEDYINGNYAYVLSSGDNLNIIDFTVIADATVSSFSLGQPGVVITTSGNYAYVAQQNQLKILDISDPVSPVSIHTVPIGSNPSAIRATDNFLYVVNVASPNSSLQIIDISSPSTAYFLKSVDLTGVVNYFDVEGGYAYLVNTGSTLQVVPIPTESSFFPVYDLNGNVSGYAPSGIIAQTVDTFSLSGNNLQLSLYGDGEPKKTVDLSSFLDNTDNQTLSLNSNTLSLTNGGSVNLSPYLDNTDAQVLSLNGSMLSLTNGGSVDLTGFGGDNLGNHTATQNLKTNGNWISNDGANNGLFVDGANNIGIGISSPASKLHVFSPTNSTLTLESDAHSGVILDRGSTSSEAAIILKNDGNFSWLFGIDNTPSGNASDFSIKTANNGNAEFLVKTDGNVGIGATNPAEKLEVNGAIKLGSTITSNAGSIRWTGSDFEGFDGSAWKSLTASASGEIDTLYGIAPLNGAPVLDAHQTSGPNVNTLNAGTGSWQSFTAEHSGVLSRIEIQHGNSNNFIDDGLLRIYIGQGTSGTLLHEQNIDDSNTNGFFAIYSLSSPVSVKAGTQYTLWVVDNFDSYSMSVSGSNPYAGGRYSGQSTQDLKFNTYIIPLTLLMGLDENTGTVSIYNGNLVIEETGAVSMSNGNLAIDNAGAFSMSNGKVIIDGNGNMGINASTPASKLHVKDDFADYTRFVMTVENTGNGSGSGGLLVQAGQNSSPGNTRFIQFNRPDGTQIGNIRQDAANSVFYATTSDQRLKTQIFPTAYGLSDLLEIDVRDYYFKDDLAHPQTGFIAQQLYRYYPVAVTVGGDDPKTDPWQVDYSKLTPLLVKSVQELNRTVDEQKQQLHIQQAEIEQLKNQNTAMQSRLDRIETMLAGSASTNNK